MLVFTTVLLILLIHGCDSRDLPFYFPRCTLNDKRLSDCIVNATNMLRPQVRKGIKEIELPAFDPLEISMIGMIQQSQNMDYNLTFWNFTIYGLDSYDFKEITFNKRNKKITGRAEFSNLYIKSNYGIQGRMLYFPVFGNGIVEGEMVNGTFQIKGKLVHRKGVRYYKPTSTDVRLKINGFSTVVGGLFPENPELAHLTSELFIINAQAIADAATPALERVTEALLFRFINTLSKLIPYSTLLPHSKHLK